MGPGFVSCICGFFMKVKMLLFFGLDGISPGHHLFVCFAAVYMTAKQAQSDALKILKVRKQLPYDRRKLVKTKQERYSICLRANQPWVGVFQTAKGVLGQVVFKVRVLSHTFTSLVCYCSPTYTIVSKMNKNQRKKRKRQELEIANVLVNRFNIIK